MDSTPRTLLTVGKDLEERLENIRQNGIHDDRTLSNVETLLHQCTNQLNQLISSPDSSVTPILLPALLRTIISLTKICSEKSDLIIPGAFLSQEKFTALINTTKTLYNQIKEFLKSPKLTTSLPQSIHLRHFCEQIHQISDSIAQIDIVLTLICQKLLVRFIAGGDESHQSQQQQRLDDFNPEFILSIYASILRQINIICGKYSRDGKDTAFLRVRTSFSKNFNEGFQI